MDRSPVVADRDAYFTGAAKSGACGDSTAEEPATVHACVVVQRPAAASDGLRSAARAAARAFATRRCEQVTFEPCETLAETAAPPSQRALARAAQLLDELLAATAAPVVASKDGRRPRASPPTGEAVEAAALTLPDFSDQHVVANLVEDLDEELEELDEEVVTPGYVGAWAPERPPHLWLSAEDACRHGGVCALWKERCALRADLCAVRDEVTPRNGMALDDTKSVEDLARKRRTDLCHYGVNAGHDGGDNIDRNARCIRLKEVQLWDWAFRDGTIDEHGYEIMSDREAVMTLNAKAPTLDVTRGGKRLEPDKTYRDLCERRVEDNCSVELRTPRESACERNTLSLKSRRRWRGGTGPVRGGAPGVFKKVDGVLGVALLVDGRAGHRLGVGEVPREAGEAFLRHPAPPCGGRGAPHGDPLSSTSAKIDNSTFWL